MQRKAKKAGSAREVQTQTRYWIQAELEPLRARWPEEHAKLVAYFTSPEIQRAAGLASEYLLRGELPPKEAQALEICQTLKHAYELLAQIKKEQLP